MGGKGGSGWPSYLGVVRTSDARQARVRSRSIIPQTAQRRSGNAFFDVAAGLPESSSSGIPASEFA